MSRMVILRLALFLTVPFRGKRCDSSLVLHTCERLAELKGISVEDCARITMENGKRFFGIK